MGGGKKKYDETADQDDGNHIVAANRIDHRITCHTESTAAVHLGGAQQ